MPHTLIVDDEAEAAEMLAALYFARDDKMGLVFSVTVGSSVQVALLTTPLLVLVSYLLHHPMNLVFVNPLELKVEAATAAYPPLEASADESAGEGIAEGGLADIATELERLIERSSTSKLQEAVERQPTKSKQKQ